MPLDPRPHTNDTGQSVSGLADHAVSMLFHVRAHVLHRLPLLPLLRLREPRSSYRLLRGGLMLNRPQRGRPLGLPYTDYRYRLYLSLIFGYHINVY